MQEITNKVESGANFIANNENKAQGIVNDIRTNLNNLLLNKVVVSYDKIKNKFMYKRTLPITTTNFKMYLKIINSEDF